MNKKAMALALTVGLLGAGGVAQAGVIYSIDTGSAGGIIGSTASDNDTSIWLNAFTVVAGGELIDSIDIAFGVPPDNGGFGPANGTAATAYLWTSASNIPDPTVDATVASSVAGTVQSIGTNTFVNFSLPVPVQLSVGDVFFAGVQSTALAVGFDDKDSVTAGQQSWFFTDNTADPLDPDALGDISVGGTFNSFSAFGDALIRVNADAAAVPEPSTLAIFGIGSGVMGFVSIRRRRR